ncbi:MAG: HAD family phosphatase [Acidobacteriota bacterium]
MIKGILFDFNGVIINDEPVQMRAYQEILKNEGIDLTEDAYYSSLGMDDKRFVEAAFDRADKTVDGEKIADITRAKTAKWREMIDQDLPLFDGIRDFVEKMSREFSLGIVSMAKLEEIDHVISRAGLAKFFSIIISAADVTACKPDPQCYREGFRRLDAFRTANGHLPMTRGECLAIEDAPPGIVAARKVGLATLGVTNTVSADEMRAAGADAVAVRLDDWMPESIRRVFV